MKSFIATPSPDEFRAEIVRLKALLNSQYDNACLHYAISYVTHGNADSSGLHRGLCKTFEKLVDKLRNPIDEPLHCDICGAKTDNPWHSSDKENRHIHSCDECHKNTHTLSKS